MYAPYLCLVYRYGTIHQLNTSPPHFPPTPSLKQPCSIHFCHFSASNIVYAKVYTGAEPNLDHCFFHEVKRFWRAYARRPHLKKSTLLYEANLFFSIAFQFAFCSVSLAKGPYSIRGLPWYIYFLGFAFVIVIVPVQELVKMHDLKEFTRFQKRSKLEFSTKVNLTKIIHIWYEMIIWSDDG